MAAIAARVRTLLCVVPDCCELPEAGGYDKWMIAALLRDLRTVLDVRVHDA